ncbi:hypothetical protein [Clostridium sp.]|uniref:hypothetical protein n=1 Tax=Clostridium sp. TaxID=1506 RepID=UPI0026DB38A0|nr:hypothetical protein [Clostridium sp.]MDO5039561.1 hypothetical protein [Clostridium sp.]
MDMKVFEFLNVEAPSSVGDIREALDLLVASIDSAIEQVGEKLNVSFVNKEFKKVSELNSNSEELYNINKRIQKVIDDLDTIIDERNIEESNEKEESYGKQIPNYSDYLVDTNIEHNLYEDLTNKRPCAFMIEGKKYEIKDWKGALTQTINYLASKNKDIITNFVDDPKMNGKKVIYFSRVKLPTMKSPREIKNANIYVETNLSANSIRNLIIKMLNKYNIKLNDYKIYLKADYSELH